MARAAASYRKPLAPDAVLTDAQADELDALLDAFYAHDTAAVDARDALAGACEAARQGQQVADLFGDGELKHPGECARPGGFTPPALRDKLPPQASEEARRARAARIARRGVYRALENPAADRRSDNATATLQQMVDAEQLALEVRAAYDARGDRATELLVRVANLQRPVGLRMRSNELVDVFGDGAIKRADLCTVPDGLDLRQRQSAPVGS